MIDISIVACVRVADGGPNFEQEAYAREGSEYRKMECPLCKQLMYIGTRSMLLLSQSDSVLACCAQCTGEALEALAPSEVLHARLSDTMDPPA